MKLVHNSNNRNPSAKKMHPLKISCTSGVEMQRTMHKVAAFCKKQKGNSLVLWDTNHHEVILWFEEEKYITYFGIKGVEEIGN